MNQKLTPEQKAILKPYQTVNAQGEVVSAITYFQGQPLNIRFSGQSGRFSRDGKEDLGPSLTITPVAWRFFKGQIFGRQPADYVELYYVDKHRNLCVLLFTNASAWILRKFMADLAYTYFEGGAQMLTTSTIRIDAAVRIRKDGGRYYVAEFTFIEPADVRAVTAFQLFCMDHKVYRTDTRTVDVEDVLWSPTYFTMIGLGVKRDSPENEAEKLMIQGSYE